MVKKTRPKTEEERAVAAYKRQEKRKKEAIKALRAEKIKSLMADLDP